MEARQDPRAKEWRELSDSSFLFTGGRIVVFECGYCHRDITVQCRIRCAVCEDLDLCSDCFSAGVSFGDHLSHHNYRVVDNLDASIFAKDWSIAEELLLLEGIEKFGLGNWKAISEHMSSKSPKQAEEHYWDCYLGVHGVCLPPVTTVDAEAVPTESLLIASRDLPEFKGVTGFVCPEDKLELQVMRIAPGGGTRGEPANPWRERVGRDTQRQKDKPDGRDKSIIGAAHAGAELPGFLPLREDFDVEFENDAENILADMEFSPDDHPSERELKLQVVRIYNRKLDERNRRKRFVMDRGIVDVKKQQHAERKRSKDDRELVARLRMFARFLTAEEHEALVDGLLKARRLKQQIEAMHVYKALGVRSLDQVKQLESEKRRRDADNKARRGREGASYLYETGRESDVLAFSASNSGAALRKNSRRSKWDGEESEEDAGEELADAAEVFEATQEDLPEGSAAMGELLSAREIEFCGLISMNHSTFMIVKEAILLEACRSGMLTEEGVRRVLRGEACQVAPNTVYDFFVTDVSSCGVETAPTSGEDAGTNRPAPGRPGRKKKKSEY